MKTSNVRLGDLFDIYKGKRLTKEDMTEGETNYIGAISENNGVREKIGQEPLFQPNCITINYNGSVGEAFYQVEPFWPSDDVNVLYLKNHALTENIAMYIITLIKKNKYRFSYGRKWTLEKMVDSDIPIPVKDDGSIDWDYIDNFINGLKNKHISTSIKKHNVDLDISKFKEFQISTIFNVKKPKNTVFSDVKEGGDTNYISRTSLNNGCQAKIVGDGLKKYDGNCISIGGESASVFYQDKPFISGNNMTLLYNDNMNKYVGMFIVTIMNLEKYRYSYGRAFNKEHVENTILRLPACADGEPDWAFMEDFIKKFSYSDRI